LDANRQYRFSRCRTRKHIAAITGFAGRRQKVTENAMGQDIAQLRWRLATLEEAKEVVVCWNAGNSERNPHRRAVLLKSA
jgi:hypothetical protein